MPVILQTALVSNLYFLSQLLHNRYAGNLLVIIFSEIYLFFVSGTKRLEIGVKIYIYIYVVYLFPYWSVVLVVDGFIK